MQHPATFEHRRHPIELLLDCAFQRPLSILGIRTRTSKPLVVLNRRSEVSQGGTSVATTKNENRRRCLIAKAALKEGYARRGQLS